MSGGSAEEPAEGGTVGVGGPGPGAWSSGTFSALSEWCPGAGAAWSQEGVGEAEVPPGRG